MKTIDLIETFIFRRLMKTITKIVGCIGLSVALWRTPHGQAVTLKQINAALNACRKESIQNLERLLKEAGSSDKASENTKTIRKLLEDYPNKKDVYYDGTGDFVLETVNGSNGLFLSKIPSRSSDKDQEGNHEHQKINPLDAISEELSADALKHRGVDVNELKGKGINKVWEITFNSILESPFFTEEQRKKAKEWFHDLNALEAAVEDYAKGCVPLYKKDGTFTIILRDTKIYTDNKGYMRAVQDDDYPVLTSCSLYLPVPADEAVTLKRTIKSALEGMLCNKNRREKIILFLLLDAKMPPEARLSWVRNEEWSFFSSMDNAFLFYPVNIEGAMSHEIGHYLQEHLGLKQTVDDYRTLFAQKLLLLENNLSGDPIEIPEELGHAISSGFDTGQKPLLKLSEKAYFEYCQLILRWRSESEISNILGVYFKSDTLYINTLSDIRELQHIRYGHEPQIVDAEAVENWCSLLKNDGSKQILEESFKKVAPKEELELLCRLHRRENPSEDIQNAVYTWAYTDLSYYSLLWDCIEN